MIKYPYCREEFYFPFGFYYENSQSLDVWQDYKRMPFSLEIITSHVRNGYQNTIF